MENAGIPTESQEEDAHWFAMALLMPDYLLNLRVPDVLFLAHE